MTKQHECEWKIYIHEYLSDGTTFIRARCTEMCNERLEETEINRRLNEYETLKNRPSIKISKGDVWLVFPNATISIEEMCRVDAPSPIVKRNLRRWREGILEKGK